VKGVRRQREEGHLNGILLSHVTPAGARTLSPNLTPVTAFKRDAGSMKREAQQLSGGQLTQFIIIKATTIL
jgi:hypothetical protein